MLLKKTTIYWYVNLTHTENGETNTTLTHLEDGEGVEIYCDEGYKIYGDAVISCEKGTWSGIVTPECRPEEGMFRLKQG